MRAAAAVPPSIMLFACAISVTFSPTRSGRMTRCEAEYGGMKAPITATIASKSPKER